MARVGVGEQLQGPAQPAQAEGVGAAERAAEELGGGRLVQLGRAQRAAQQHQQRPGAWLVGQRQLVPGHRDRHVGRGQRPAQQRHLPGRRAHQDGHRRPGHPVGQVGAAQRVGDQRGLLGRAVRDQDADLTRRGIGHRNQVTVTAVGGGQPAGHPAGRGQQDRAAAAAGAQRHHRRRLAVRGAEPVRELGEGAHVGAAERVDGLVRVADRDQLAALARQRHQQRLLSRVAVLVLVDQHYVVRAALALPGLLAAEQGGGDADDLGVVVGRDRREVEARRVPVEERGGRHPVVAVPLLAELAQPPAVQPALGRAQQQVAHLLGEAPGGQGRPQPLRPAGAAVLGLAAQHAAHLEELLGRGEQLRRLVAGQHELAAGQRVGVTVEGHRQRLAGGPAQPGGDALAQLGRRLTAEGENQDPLGRNAAPLDPVGDRGHDRGRLAGAGPGQHQQRAARVVHHLLLRLVQARRFVRRQGPADEAVRGCVGLVHQYRFQQTALTFRD